MDIDRFIASNRPSWDRLADLTARADRTVARLSADELDELVRLYQRASSHLSIARTTYRDGPLVSFLTGLVARAAAVVYGSAPRTWRNAARAVSVTFPAAVWHLRWFVAASTLLFVVPAAVLAVWIGGSPEAFEATAPAAVREAYVERDFEAYYSSQPAAEFASSVFVNNAQVGFLAFAVGILFCVPTALVLALNGANLGIAAGLFAAVGQQPKFWGLILPHGLLELTAVFVAGAAGLRLGWALVDPGDRPRRDALADEARRAVVVVIGLVGVFAVAGLIEGFVTGSTLPTAARVGIGVAAELAFLLYVGGLGRAAARAGFTGAMGEGSTRQGWARQADAPASAPDTAPTTTLPPTRTFAG